MMTERPSRLTSPVELKAMKIVPLAAVQFVVAPMAAWRVGVFR